MAGMQFARDARAQCQLDQPAFRLYIVQTLALLALHAFSINQGSQAWFYLGAFSPGNLLICRHRQQNRANNSPEIRP